MHLAAGALAGDHAGGLEDAQVLADQRLRHLERVDEFVHAARRLAQLQHDRDAHRCGQRAQQVAGGVEDFARRQIRQRGGAALVVVAGLRKFLLLLARAGHSGNGFHYVRHDTCAIAHVNGVAAWASRRTPSLRC